MDKRYNYSNLLGAIRAEGLTQEELALSIGINCSTLNNKLRGKAQFKASEMQEIMSALGLPMSDIVSYFFAH